MESLIPESFISECREKIREVELRQEWLQKHSFQEEVRVLQIKIGGMFQIYNALLDYNKSVTNQ